MPNILKAVHTFLRSQIHLWGRSPTNEGRNVDLENFGTTAVYAFSSEISSITNSSHNGQISAKLNV